MIVKSAVHKMANSIGFDIGCTDDETQADLLNGFCKAIRNSMPNKNERELQICYFVARLDDNAVKVLKIIHEFIEARED